MKTIKLEDIKNEILTQKGIQFLFIESKECKNCKEVVKNWQEVTSKFKKENIKFFALNLDENPNFSAYFKVEELPVVFMFRNGALTKTLQADLSKEKIEKLIDDILNPPAKTGKYPDIKVFTTPTCPYCHMLKQYLNEKGVPFEEIDVSVNQEWAYKMVQKSGQMGVPQMWIGDEVIIGFDKARIDAILGL